MNPLIVLISGPSGVGKDSVINKLRDDFNSINVIITATTRTIRAGEINGRDYIFVDQKDFERMKKANEFLEYANVYGNQYGVPKDQVKAALSRGQGALIKADVQGANTIMKLEPCVLSIFIMPESINDLEKRLTKRMTESKQALKVRLDTAMTEIDQSGNFEFIVYNKEDRIEQTLQEIEKNIFEAKNASTKRVFNLIDETAP
ncbi:MAG: guanylate kinase [Chloroflexota bacterium]|nr:MAG: guanylate kinase [Chloroflexota bacterium]